MSAPVGTRKNSRKLILLEAYTLPYAPHDAIGIANNEIADAPGPVHWGFRLDVVVVLQILILNMLPPRFDIHHEQVHQEVADKIFVAEVLQQEA